MSPQGSPDLPNPATNLQTTAIRFQTTSNQPPDHRMDPKIFKNTSRQLPSTPKSIEFLYVKLHFSQFHIFRQKPHKKQPRATQRLPNDSQRLPKAFQRLPKVTKITPRTPKMTKKAPRTHNYPPRSPQHVSNSPLDPENPPKILRDSKKPVTRTPFSF